MATSLSRAARAALAIACIAFSLVACSSKKDDAAKAPEIQGTATREQQPAFTVGGFSIDFADKALTPITLQPGEEQFPCLIFPLTITGPSHIVGGGRLTPAPGLHHGNVTTRPKTGEGVRVCPDDDNSAIGGEALDILNGGAVLFGSSTQIQKPEWRTFPDGEGFRVKDGFEIVARMHYLNVGDTPITVAPKYDWFTIDESKVTLEIFPFIWQLSNWMIAPHQSLTASATCGFPPGMHIVNVLPHMHKLGTNLSASFFGGPQDGEKFLDSPGYDPANGVQVNYDPALDLTNAMGVTFSCTWNNTTDQAIVEGTGINEMCMVFGYGWPKNETYTLRASPSSADSNHCLYITTP